MPAGHDIAILKDIFMKNPSKIQFLRTSFRLQVHVPNKESQRCLSYTGHACWFLSMPLPNIIKIFQTI